MPRNSSAHRTQRPGRPFASSIDCCSPTLEPTPFGQRPLLFTYGDAYARHLGEAGPAACVLAFGRAIADLLADPARAALIGRRGRLLAETRFHYALYGQTLAEAFAEIVETARSR